MSTGPPPKAPSSPSLLLDFPRTRDGVRPVRMMVFGPPGSGKTYLAGVLLRPPNFAPKERLQMCGPVPTLARELDVPWHNISPTDRVEQDRYFKPIAETDEHLFIAIDEFDAYCTKNGYKSPYLYHIMNFDRNFGKGVLAIARGTSDVSTNAIASCDLILWFRTTEKNLLKYIRETLKGFPGGPGEAERTVAELPKYQCLMYCPLSENRFPGFMKVVHGNLWISPLPVESESEMSEDSLSSDDASPRTVGGSFPADAGRTSASGTILSGPGT